MSAFDYLMGAWFGITAAIVALYPFAIAYMVWHKRKGGRDENSSNIPDA